MGVPKNQRNGGKSEVKEPKGSRTTSRSKMNNSASYRHAHTTQIEWCRGRQPRASTCIVRAPWPSIDTECAGCRRRKCELYISCSTTVSTLSLLSLLSTCAPISFIYPTSVERLCYALREYAFLPHFLFASLCFESVSTSRTLTAMKSHRPQRPSLVRQIP